MITIQTDEVNNDLVLKDGNLVIIGDVDQIAQSVREALGTFFGEWFLDNNIGIPYFQQIFVANPNLDLIQFQLINAVQAVGGVASVNSFEFGYDNGKRELSVTMIIKTTNGQTINVEKTVGA